MTTTNMNMQIATVAMSGLLLCFLAIKRFHNDGLA
jgi:hypothetical protein